MLGREGCKLMSCPSDMSATDTVRLRSGPRRASTSGGDMKTNPTHALLGEPRVVGDALEDKS